MIGCQHVGRFWGGRSPPPTACKAERATTRLYCLPAARDRPLPAMPALPAATLVVHMLTSVRRSCGHMLDLRPWCAIVKGVISTHTRVT
jgi:hypothetical protein